MLEFCQWLDQSSVGTAIRQSLWLFPAIETVHLLGMAALVGTIGVLDLRLLGWVARQQPVSKMAARLIPWAWVGITVQVITGTLLFSSEAVKIYGNPGVSIEDAAATTDGAAGGDFSDVCFEEAYGLGGPCIIACAGEGRGVEFHPVMGGNCYCGALYRVCVGFK